MDRKEAFKNAVASSKEEKKRKASGTFGGGSFETVPYSALVTDQLSVVRILGLPEKIRDQYSPKTVGISMLTDDDGKPFRCIWPKKADQPGWLLWKVLDLVLKKEYNRSTESSKYIFQESHPEAFNIVFKNGKRENQAYYSFEKGWRPQFNVLMNVIDRANYDWHVANKQTLILSKKATSKTKPDGSTSTFYDAGVPQSLYETIINDLVAAYGDWEEFDIGILKLSETPFYKVYNVATHKPELILKFKDAVDKMSTSPLTVEERSWKLHDIDAKYPVTTYKKIKSRLSKKLALIDKEFKTTFLDQLEALVNEERILLNSKGGHGVTSNGTPTFDPEEIEAEEEAAASEAPAPETKPVAAEANDPPVRKNKSAPTSAVTEEVLTQKGFKGYSLLSKPMKESITGLNADGSLAYLIKPGESIYRCNECGFMSPGSFSHCPKCANAFE